MRSLQRILIERRTRRFLDEMIDKYADIQLSSTRKRSSRRRRRSGLDPHKIEDNQKMEPQQIERSCSSECRTASDFGSALSSTRLARLHQEEEQQDIEHDDRQQDGGETDWCPDSESGIALSSTRLARLQEVEEQSELPCPIECRSASASSSAAVSSKEAEENQSELSCRSGCHTASTSESPPTSTQRSGYSQEELPCSQECHTASPQSPPPSRLPRLHPVPPPSHVCANCCDFFPSPHPHYAKEVIGKSGDKPEESVSISSRTNSSNTQILTEVDEHEGGGEDNRHRDKKKEGDVFGMWDYVCPQFLRRVYANEWV